MIPTSYVMRKYADSVRFGSFMKTNALGPFSPIPIPSGYINIFSTEATSESICPLTELSSPFRVLTTR